MVASLELMLQRELPAQESKKPQGITYRRKAFVNFLAIDMRTSSRDLKCRWGFTVSYLPSLGLALMPKKLNLVLHSKCITSRYNIQALKKSKVLALDALRLLRQPGCGQPPLFRGTGRRH